MKKFVCALCAVLMSFATVACGSSKEQKPEETEITTEEEEKSKELVQGKWIVNQTKQSKLDKEDAERFQKATVSEDMDASAVAILADQIVSGKNYLYLYQAKDKETGFYHWGVASLCENLDYKVFMNSYGDIDLASLITKPDSDDGVDANLVGGWVFKNHEESDIDLSDNAVLADAVAKTGYKAVALLGTNESKTSYLIFARHVNKEGKVLDYHVLEIGPGDENALAVISNQIIDLNKYLKIEVTYEKFDIRQIHNYGDDVVATVEHTDEEKATMEAGTGEQAYNEEQIFAEYMENAEAYAEITTE